MFWSVKEIAEALSYKEKTVWKIVYQPDFPMAIRWTPGASPRWDAEEVKAWFLARKEAA